MDTIYPKRVKHIPNCKDGDEDGAGDGKIRSSTPITANGADVEAGEIRAGLLVIEQSIMASVDGQNRGYPLCLEILQAPASVRRRWGIKTG